MALLLKHIQNIDLSTKIHFYIFPPIEIHILIRRNFIDTIFIICEYIILTVHKKAFCMDFSTAVSYLIVCINSIFTVIIKLISMCMSAYIYKIFIRCSIRTPITFRRMRKDNSIFITNCRLDFFIQCFKLLAFFNFLSSVQCIPIYSLICIKAFIVA